MTPPSTPKDNQEPEDVGSDRATPLAAAQAPVAELARDGKPPAILQAAMGEGGILMVDINDSQAAIRRRGWTFFAVTLIMLAMLGTALLSLNVAVNPRSRFDTDHYPPLIPDFFDTKLAAYDALPEAPEIVVLGSSRSLKISPPVLTNLTGQPAFNFAVPGASLEDALSLYRFLAQRGDAPDRVLFGFEEVQFSQLIVPKLPRSRAWQDITGEAGLWADAKVLYETINPGYVKDVGRVLYYAHIAGGFPEQHLIVDELGEGQYVAFERDIAAGTFDFAAARQAHWEQEARPTYVTTLGLDADKIAVLDELIQLTAAHGTRLTLFLTPFQPDALEDLQELDGFEAVHREAIEALEARCGQIDVYDYTDVASFGGDGQSFYDNFHYRSDNAALLVEALLAGQGSLCPA